MQEWEYIFKYWKTSIESHTFDGILPKLEILHEEINDIFEEFFGSEEPLKEELVSHSLTIVGSDVVLTAIFRRPI